MKFECDGKDADEVTVSQRTEMAGWVGTPAAKPLIRLPHGYRSAHQVKSFNGLPMNDLQGVYVWRRFSETMRICLQSS